MRLLMEQIRALPQEERRNRMTALMENPAFQERVEQREAARGIYFGQGIMISSPNGLRLIMDYTPVHEWRTNRLFADGSIR